MIPRLHRHQRLAFSVVETAFSILLVSSVMVAALNGVGAATTGRQFADGRARGQLLAEGLMTEIMAQAYQDEDKLGAQGLETGEADVNREKFDDVDDYRFYTDAPPELVNGDPIQGFSEWSRTVSVTRADPLIPNAVPATESWLKRIEVIVRRNGVPVASLVEFKTGTDPVAGKTKAILVKEIEMEPPPPPEVTELEHF